MPKTSYLNPEESRPLDKKYYSPQEVAAVFGISESLLNKMRIRGTGPKYLKFSHRNVRYPAAEIAQYVEEHMRRSTSE